MLFFFLSFFLSAFFQFSLDKFRARIV